MPSELMTAVAQRIKDLRRLRGLSARELAERCAEFGVPSLTRSTIAKIESGVRRFVTLDELEALALALEIAPHVLLQAASGISTPSVEASKPAFGGGVVGPDPESALESDGDDETAWAIGRVNVPSRADVSIICAYCPAIYSESDITASRGEESTSLAEALGTDRTDRRSSGKRPGKGAMRRIIGQEAHSGTAAIMAGDRQRGKLANLSRLKDWVFTCPNGHIVDGSREYQIPLAVVGAPGSSKSHFLPGLIWETSVMRALSPLGVSLRPGQFTSSQLSYAVRELYDENKVLSPTPPSEVVGPFGYRLAIREGDEEDRYSLLLFDNGGEALSSVSKIGELAAFVLLAQGLIVLIDPHGPVVTRFDDPDAEAIDRARVIAAARVRDSITLVADALEELWDSPMRDIPIPACFVVAKADSLRWEYEWDKETATVITEVQRGSSLRHALLESSDRVKKAFSDYGGGLIVEEIEDRFSSDRTRFIAASATSGMPMGDHWENPTPNGASLALLNVLDILGMTHASQANDANAAEPQPAATAQPDAV